jgi:hypothetical protein
VGLWVATSFHTVLLAVATHADTELGNENLSSWTSDAGDYRPASLAAWLLPSTVLLLVWRSRYEEQIRTAATAPLPQPST